MHLNRKRYKNEIIAHQNNTTFTRKPTIKN